MNERIEQLLGSIGKLMQGHLAKRDFESVTQFEFRILFDFHFQTFAIEL